MVVGCDWSATGCRYSVTVALTLTGVAISWQLRSLPGCYMVHMVVTGFTPGSYGTDLRVYLAPKTEQSIF